jgi:hypothetical protein
MSEWINVEDELPPLEVPVWILLPNYDQPTIGCRTGDGEGWVWARCYYLVNCYWNPDTRGWEVQYRVADNDYHPTHWQYLPQPLEVKP